VLIVAIGLFPIWVRSPLPVESTDERAILTMTALDVPELDSDRVRAVGAWRLESPNHFFGSYSALASLGDGTLLAASDSGTRLRFTPPGNTGPGPEFGQFSEPRFGEKRYADIEALTRNAATGQVWAAFEQSNHIERYDAALRSQARAEPAAMRDWWSNSGPEAMVRLSDGRFVVLAESGEGWFGGDMPGVLFAGDPVEGAAEVGFRFVPPAGFRPVDMALLPGGKVLILLRRVVWGVPPRFAGKLVLADPATIREGVAWRGEVVADLRAPLPSDNYEGLAVEAEPGRGTALWLISDDNRTQFQRTLLLKLARRDNEKARGTTRAPR
jgi:hypothetical protein